MNILCIGNSFSVDATRYLQQIARTQGVELRVAVLYYPGCTLEQHHRFMLRESEDYILYFNGFSTGFKMTLKQALLSQRWDVITMQQGSVHSANFDNYEPYLTEVATLVKKCAPKAKLVVQQTWAYEDGSERLLKTGYESYRTMFADIEKSYVKMVETIQATGLIPSGRLMQTLMDRGIEKVHRDTLHVTMGLGRYALGLLWFRMLTGKSVADVDFNDFDEPIPEEHIKIAKEEIEKLQPIF